MNVDCSPATMNQTTTDKPLDPLRLLVGTLQDDIAWLRAELGKRDGYWAGVARDRQAEAEALRKKLAVMQGLLGEAVTQCRVSRADGDPVDDSYLESWEQALQT